VSADTRSEILAELGRGDEVAVAERVKSAAHELAQLLDELPGNDNALTADRVDELQAQASPAAEAFLGVSFPVVEYGRGFAVDALPRALQEIASATAAAPPENARNRYALIPTVGRIVWSLTAYALHCDRPKIIVALARGRIEVPSSDGQVMPAIALQSLRHPDVLAQDANVAFQNYCEWLAGLELLQAYPTFAVGRDACVCEADLVLAMLSAHYRGDTYSQGWTRFVVRRFSERLNDLQQRAAFDELFAGERDFEERIDSAYQQVRGDTHRVDRPPARLFGRTG
jgi:hypothetical protein